jgi:hypothetical protein
MASPDFQPKVPVNREALEEVLNRTGPSTLGRLGARVVGFSSEDAQNANVAVNAMDGDPDTFWHTRWQPKADPMPHHLVFDLGRPVAIAGVAYLPRQDQANGRIRDIEIYSTSDTNNWGTAIARAQWPNMHERQTLMFPKSVEARWVKFLVRSEARAQAFASAAEFDIIPTNTTNTRP